MAITNAAAAGEATPEKTSPNETAPQNCALQRPRWLLLCFARCFPLCIVLGAAGCAREEPRLKEAGEQTAAPEMSSAAEPLGLDSAEPAESSLSIKRAVVTAVDGQLRIRLCNESADLPVVEQNNEALRALIEESREPPQAMYVEAYGERKSSPQSGGGAFVLEQLLYAHPQQGAKPCEQSAPDYVVAARGNEPFWRVEVTHSAIVWRQPDAPHEITLEEPRAEPSEGTVRYFASNAEHELELLVGERQCHDSMSGEFFAFAARARFDGTEFTGCARVGQ